MGSSNQESDQLASITQVTAFRWALLATLAAVLLLLSLSTFVPAANIWGRPEKPKQCEALTEEARSVSARLRGAYLYRTEVLKLTLREPQNTWSNLPFLFIGVYLLTGAGGQIIERWMGGVLVYQFFASSLYHASLMPLFRNFDMAGVFAIGGLLLSMALARVSARKINDWRICAAAAGAFAILSMLRQRVRIGDFAPLDTMIIIPIVGAVLFIAVLYVKFYGHDSRNLGLAGLVTFGTGLAVGGLDRVGQCLCAPGSWVQGHTVWHVCAAIAAFLFCRWAGGAKRESSQLANSASKC